MPRSVEMDSSAMLNSWSNKLGRSQSSSDTISRSADTASVGVLLNRLREASASLSETNSREEFSRGLKVLHENTSPMSSASGRSPESGNHGRHISEPTMNFNLEDVETPSKSGTWGPRDRPPGLNQLTEIATPRTAKACMRRFILEARRSARSASMSNIGQHLVEVCEGSDDQSDAPASPQGTQDDLDKADLIRRVEELDELLKTAATSGLELVDEVKRLTAENENLRQIMHDIDASQHIECSPEGKAGPKHGQSPSLQGIGIANMSSMASKNSRVELMQEILEDSERMIRALEGEKEKMLDEKSNLQKKLKHAVDERNEIHETYNNAIDDIRSLREELEKLKATKAQPASITPQKTDSDLIEAYRNVQRLTSEVKKKEDEVQAEKERNKIELGRTHEEMEDLMQKVEILEEENSALNSELDQTKRQYEAQLSDLKNQKKSLHIGTTSGLRPNVEVPQTPMTSITTTSLFDEVSTAESDTATPLIGGSRRGSDCSSLQSFQTPQTPKTPFTPRTPIFASGLPSGLRKTPLSIGTGVPSMTQPLSAEMEAKDKLIDELRDEVREMKRQMADNRSKEQHSDRNMGEVLKALRASSAMLADSMAEVERLKAHFGDGFGGFKQKIECLSIENKDKDDTISRLRQEVEELTETSESRLSAEEKVKTLTQAISKLEENLVCARRAQEKVEQAEQVACAEVENLKQKLAALEEKLRNVTLENETIQDVVDELKEDLQTKEQTHISEIQALALEKDELANSVREMKESNDRTDSTMNGIAAKLQETKAALQEAQEAKRVASERISHLEREIRGNEGTHTSQMKHIEAEKQNIEQELKILKLEHEESLSSLAEMKKQAEMTTQALGKAEKALNQSEVEAKEVKCGQNAISVAIKATASTQTSRLPIEAKVITKVVHSMSERRPMAAAVVFLWAMLLYGLLHLSIGHSMGSGVL